MLNAVKQSHALSPKYRTYFRLVEVDDADYICALRNDATLNAHLNPPPTSAEQQQLWIGGYKEREQEGREFYFVIISGGEKRGIIRMYDFRDIAGERCFSWGSWIIPPPRLPGIVTFSAITLYEIGFDILKFNRAHFKVAKSNVRVRKFHERTGAQLEWEEGDDQHFLYSPAAYAQFRQSSERQIHLHRCASVLAGA